MQTANPVLKRIDKQASEPTLPGHPSLYLGITPTPPETGAPVAFPDVMVKSGILFAICVVMAFAGWWTIEIAPGTKLDPAAWGPYVVVKPSRGACVMRKLAALRPPNPGMCFSTTLGLPGMKRGSALTAMLE